VKDHKKQLDKRENLLKYKEELLEHRMKEREEN